MVFKIAWVKEQREFVFAKAMTAMRGILHLAGGHSHNSVLSFKPTGQLLKLATV